MKAAILIDTVMETIYLVIDTYIRTYNVFVIGHITEDIIQVKDSAIPVFQPIDLDPIAGVLEKGRMGCIKKKKKR